MILTKEGVAAILSIPCHAGRDVKRTLLANLVDLAGLTADEYRQLFSGKRLRRG